MAEMGVPYCTLLTRARARARAVLRLCDVIKNSSSLTDLNLNANMLTGEALLSIIQALTDSFDTCAARALSCFHPRLCAPHFVGV